MSLKEGTDENNENDGDVGNDDKILNVVVKRITLCSVLGSNI
jgi:hypothetical protein